MSGASSGDEKLTKLTPTLLPQADRHRKDERDDTDN